VDLHIILATERKRLLQLQLLQPFTIRGCFVLVMVNAAVLILMAFLLRTARSRHDRMKAIAVLITLLALDETSSYGRHITARDDTVAVLFLSAMRERRSNPTGVHDHRISHIMRVLTYGNAIQFKQMFRVSRIVFNAILEELHPFLMQGRSPNRRQNVSAELKLGVSLYYMAHGGDAIHLEAASGLSKATALKYLHQVAGLICSKLAPKWMGETILNDPNYMDANRERFRARNGFSKVGAAIDGTHIPYQPNAGEYEQDYKNYKMWTSMLCIGIVNAYHLFIDIDIGWPGRLHDKTIYAPCATTWRASLHPS
jgi:hypothetical protein